MTTTYKPFKIVTLDNQHLPEGWDMQKYNNQLLRDGVVKDGITVHCVALRDITLEEVYEYGRFVPPFCSFGRVEEYENGALNIFVRDFLDTTTVGVIVVRP